MEVLVVETRRGIFEVVESWIRQDHPELEVSWASSVEDAELQARLTPFDILVLGPDFREAGARIIRAGGSEIWGKRPPATISHYFAEYHESALRAAVTDEVFRRRAALGG